MTRLYLVDDHPVVREGLRAVLESAGHTVLGEAGDATLALADIVRLAPELVLLDVNLPGQSGFELCQAWRERSQIPIILLTAMGQKADKVRGLQLGADDYVTKPFELEELLARIHAVLRRARTPGSTLVLGDVTVNFSARTALRGNEELDLTHRDFEILQYLAGRPHTIVSRDELLRAVWGYPDTAATRAVDHAIARLRKKIEGTAPVIATVHGVGYRYDR